MTRHVITKSTDCRTDDPDGLQNIMDHINDDSRFVYMQRDGGGLSVVSFLGDKLALLMRDSCGTCTAVKIAGTKRHVQLSLAEDFSEVTVIFQTAPTAAPGFQVRPG